jgi:predicted SAM-dependent methyltransferase
MFYTILESTRQGKYKARQRAVFFLVVCMILLISLGPTQDVLNSSGVPEMVQIRKWESQQMAAFPGVRFGYVQNCSHINKFKDPAEINRTNHYDSWLFSLSERLEKKDKLLGLELGALHRPAPVPTFCHMKYLDGENVNTLRLMYPELDSFPLVEADILDRAETMSKVDDDAFDFLVASHLLEHTQNVLLALQNQLRVVRKGGFIFLVVPNMCKTFDRSRLLTSVTHVLNEYRDSQLVVNNEFEHHREFALSSKGSILNQAQITAVQIEEAARKFMAEGYHIHYHTFTPSSFFSIMMEAQKIMPYPFDILLLMQQNLEIWCILTKL